MTTLRPSARSTTAARWRALAGAALMLLVSGPALAQTAPTPPIDSDLVRPGASPTVASVPASPPTYPAVPAYPAPTLPSAGIPADPTANPGYANRAEPAANAAQPSTAALGNGCVSARAADGTYSRDDLIGAAEGVFGQAAHGLADIIQDLLKKQGRPDGYIAGREGGGAIGVGLRYGSGKLCSQIIGATPVYWTGPSIGFDAGANAARSFVLVYNLTRADDLFRRFGAGEGQAYLIGGFNVSYLRRGSVVLIPVRSGVGLRLGINGGYMKFSRRQNWFPF